MSGSVPSQTPSGDHSEPGAKQRATALPDEVKTLNVNKFLGCISYFPPLPSNFPLLTLLSKKDPTTMSTLILPAGSAILIRRGASVHLSLADIPKRIPVDSNFRMDEQIYNSTVLVDGVLGVAWTPYVFYGDGKMHHTGTNVFSIWKTNGWGWFITVVADIARDMDEKTYDAFEEAEKWEGAQGNRKGEGEGV